MTLTPRQIEVLQHLADDGTVKTAARTLAISPHTVRSHIMLMRDRLGVHSIAQAVAVGFRRGWLK